MKYFRNKYSEVELTKKNNWADIYSAINNSTNEKVQLRVLKKQSNNTNYINVITSEIEQLQYLKHENLIGINCINSFIENEGVYYYIETEYFNGKSLSDRMILKSHTCKESLEIIKQVAKGLNEFHYRGLNYETLSAENIFINSQNVVKLDVLSYISQKYDEDEEYDNYEEVEEEIEIDNDIYAIGTILYQLITRDSDFKLKKLKKNIDDDEIYSMLYALTSKKKKYKYENINAFLCDINEYLSSDYEQGVDVYETDDEYEEDYKDKKSIIIKRFCACLAVVLVLGGGIKVMGLVKGDKDENEATIEMAIEKESTDKDVEKQEIEENLEQDQLEETQAESTDNKTTSNSTTTNANKENTNTTQNSNNQSPTTKPNTGSTDSVNGSENQGSTGSTGSEGGSENQGTTGSTGSEGGSENQGTTGSTGSEGGSGSQGSTGGSGSEGGSQETEGIKTESETLETQNIE